VGLGLKDPESTDKSHKDTSRGKGGASCKIKGLCDRGTRAVTKIFVHTGNQRKDTGQPEGNSRGGGGKIQKIYGEVKVYESRVNYPPMEELFNKSSRWTK